MSPRRLGSWLLLAGCLAGTGCGASAVAARAGQPALLPASVVPGLQTVTRPLAARDLVAESSMPGFPRLVRGWGYLSGWQRTFQGESHRLTLVVSQSLRFRTSAGAARFVAYVRRHVQRFFPFATVRRLSLPGRPGWLFHPPGCACHLATPVLVAVAAQGRQVLWMEINGPSATSSALLRLFRAVPSG
jgi:hypothetical protein